MRPAFRSGRRVTKEGGARFRRAELTPLSQPGRMSRCDNKHFRRQTGCMFWSFGAGPEGGSDEQTKYLHPLTKGTTSRQGFRVAETNRIEKCGDK